MNERTGLTFPIARVIRFVTQHELPDVGVVSHLDVRRNLLRVSKPKWDTLDKKGQEMVIRTSSVLITSDMEK